MKNILMYLLLSLSLFNAQASICTDSHLQRSTSRADQKVLGIDHSYTGFGGAFYTHAALDFLSVGAITYVTAGVGLFLITKSVIGIIREPKHKLIIKIIASIDNEKEI